MSACFGKARASAAGTRVCLPPGSTVDPPTSRGVDSVLPGFEAGIAFSEVGFQWKDAAEGTCQLHPSLWRSVTPAPCSGCIDRRQERIVCPVVASQTVSPLENTLQAGSCNCLWGRMPSPSRPPRCCKSTRHLGLSVRFAGTGCFKISPKTLLLPALSWGVVPDEGSSWWLFLLPSSAWAWTWQPGPQWVQRAPSPLALVSWLCLESFENSPGSKLSDDRFNYCSRNVAGGRASFSWPQRKLTLVFLLLD